MQLSMPKFECVSTTFYWSCHVGIRVLATAWIAITDMSAKRKHADVERSVYANLHKRCINRI
jgi:hypothetical protein